MEFIKTLLRAVIEWVTDIFLQLISELSKVPFLGEKDAIIIVYGIYIISLLLFGVLSVLFFLKKKYKTSTYFFVIFLLMVSYFISISYNVGQKAN